MFVFLFDIDGTLIHSAGAGRDALDCALQSAFGVETKNAIDLGGRTDRGIASELFALHDIELNEPNWDRFQSAYLAALPDRLSEREGGVLPGVESLLDALGKLEQVHLGLLTGNVRHGARIKLSHFRLWDHFSFGGFGDAHEQRDDVAREAVRAAKDALASRPDAEYYVIGDTVRDVRCARAVGAQAIAVCTGAATREELAAESPDVLLEDLAGDQSWWAAALG